MRDSISTVLTHCSRTLPDSLSERKELLAAIANIMTAEHPAFPVVKALLASIETGERLQAQLPLVFAEAKKAK